MKIHFCTLLHCISFILFLLCGINATAQTRKADVIIRRDSTRIEALILEVEELVVKYKKYSDQEGPTFSLGKKEIASIQYGNGEIENFPVSAEIYFDEGPKPVESYEPPITRMPEQRSSSSLQRGSMSSLSNSQLRQNYRLYLKKTTSYRTMAAVGAAMMVGLTTAGIITISAAERDYNSTGGSIISSSQYGNRVIGGAYLIMGGLFGGTPLTIIGLVKKRSYSKKAAAIKSELNRRNEPISIGISPGYDIYNRTAIATLRVNF